MTDFPTELLHPVMPSTRLEKARERLWRRLMQARREGARFVVVDLQSFELAVAARCEEFGKDGADVLVDEAHE